ncbi:MAG: SDR family oxidoreductase [Dehalococcoidia bacterium]|nr:SDR family oxidoreductase [Dehalococcoidia bacterium]
MVKSDHIHSLEEKVAIVTGAGSGIGRAIAVLFARQGGKVVVNDREAPLVHETARQIISDGGDVLVQEGDASLSAVVDRIVQAALNKYKKIDILVNVVGGSQGVVLPLDETTEEDWDRVISVNLKSNFLMSKAVLPVMMRNHSGTIINLGSTLGLSGVPGMAAYSASKGAVISLTRQMAVDYGRYGIRINCLCPGPIWTPGMERFVNLKGPGILNELNAATLVGRLGQPEDVARAALFLASDDSSFATGSVLVIDGGYDHRLVKQ